MSDRDPARSTPAASDPPPNYLAPTDLAHARRLVEAMVAVRCREHGAAVDGSEAVVRLRPGPLEAQLGQITAETVCVVADVVLWRADQSDLSALAEALGQDRSLLFIEPTADLGWRHRLHRLGRRLWRLRLRHDFSAGLVVTTTDRFGLGRRGIRTYVRGEAMNFPGK